MGGAVSSGCDNDDLIDKLKEKDYIKTVEVERVFRMVDRAHYYLEDARESAYEDLAWKNGTLHLSAPCIYSKVMEALELKRGLSFLNLGSGTGYLSTMVGFSIGPYGINHGIELHADNVVYAKKRLEEFIEGAPRFDDLELCEPKFVVGNCLNLAPENRLYDRVYCGAACSPEQLEVLQNMIKVGGILVSPVGDQLLKIRRLSTSEFSSQSVLPVSFASLVLPAPRQPSDETVMMPEVNPLSLQSISRIVIRNAIRSTFEFNLPVAKASRSRQRWKRSEREVSPWHRDTPFNLVPTRDGIMVLEMGSHRLRGWSQRIPLGQRSMVVATASDIDDSPVEDGNIEEDEEEGEEDDADFLDQTLHLQAQALRRMRQRSKMGLRRQKVPGNATDSSEDEGMPLSEDVNGNSTKDRPGSSSSGEAGNGHEAASNSTQQGRFGSSTPRKKKKASGMTRSARSEETTPPALVEDVSDSGSETSNKRHKREESGETEPGSSCSPAASHKQAQGGENTQQGNGMLAHSSSLSSADGVALTNEMELETSITSRASNSSLVIDVPANGAPRKPGKIQQQTSYSTSADTSETSGFGSLGDDPALNLGSFKEEDLASPDVFQASSLEVSTGTGAWPSTSGASGKERDTDVENTDAPWMEMEEYMEGEEKSTDTSLCSGAGEADRQEAERNLDTEEQDDESSTTNLDDSDVNMSHVLARFSRLVKRGQSNSSSGDSDDSGEENETGEETTEGDEATKTPSFSSFLKEKVDTLPIPNAIKAFILHYR